MDSLHQNKNFFDFGSYMMLWEPDWFLAPKQELLRLQFLHYASAFSALKGTNKNGNFSKEASDF
jgi:hypothetical protein